MLGNTADAALPPELANGMPQLLQGLVRLLLDLKEQQELVAKRADSEEDDEGPVSGLDVWGLAESACLLAVTAEVGSDV